MTTTKDILIKAREIISDEKNWTQGIEARDKDGNAVAYFNPLAICFCSIGAVERAAFLTNGDPARALCALTTGEIYYSNIAIAKFNDNSSHAEVLAMFDTAIANVD
jgi:hypothetical protein